VDIITFVVAVLNWSLCMIW